MTLLILSLIIPSCTEKKEAENTSPTNIILIVADDLGYGDISAANLSAAPCDSSHNSVASTKASILSEVPAFCQM